jgi:hypothetical protein
VTFLESLQRIHVNIFYYLLGYIYSYSVTKCKYRHKHTKRMKGGRIEKMRFVEGDKSKVICNFCNKIIPRTKYTDHCLSLHPTSVDCFSCEHCGKKFIDKQAFRNHKERVHQITDKQNYCKKCKIGYAQVHNCLNNKKNTSCPYRGCKKQFQTKQGLQLHIKRDHENNRPFTCNYCSKGFVNSKSRNEHIKNTHQPVGCDICHKSISNHWELRKHKVFVHKQTEGCHFCELCPKSVFFSPQTFLKHCATKHADDSD